MERQLYTEENRCTIGQAESMARISNLVLAPEQVADYIRARQSKDKLFMGMSDHEILYHCLSPEQQEQFSKVFNTTNFNK